MDVRPGEGRMLYDDIAERRPHGGWPRPTLLAWSALLAVATVLTPFAVWGVVRLATLVAG